MVLVIGRCDDCGYRYPVLRLGEGAKLEDERIVRDNA